MLLHTFISLGQSFNGQIRKRILCRIKNLKPKWSSRSPFCFSSSRLDNLGSMRIINIVSFSSRISCMFTVLLLTMTSYVAVRHLFHGWPMNDSPFSSSSEHNLLDPTRSNLMNMTPKKKENPAWNGLPRSSVVSVVICHVGNIHSDLSKTIWTFISQDTFVTTGLSDIFRWNTHHNSFLHL